MSSDNQNFELIRGQDKTITIAVVDDDGAVVNIAGAAITWLLADELGGTTTLTKTVGSGITIVNEAGGIFSVTLAEADTETLDAGWYYHEAQVEDSSSNKTIVTTGLINLRIAQNS